MKVNLIVTATGPNSGRAIPIVGAKFLIGRDPQCHLRPASQAISKLHCAILVRDGKVFAQDYGSTNGTQVDGEAFTGERELTNGCALKMGPLEFRVEILPAEKKPDSTPLPEVLKAAGSEATAKLAATAGQPAPKPKPASTPAAKPTGTAVPKPASTSAAKPVPAPAPKPPEPAPTPIPAASHTSAEEDGDAAAMLLGLDDSDGDPPKVPEGSTVFEMPAVNADGTPAAPKEDPKKKKTPTGAQMSAAANDILRKYIRRTGN